MKRGFIVLTGLCLLLSACGGSKVVSVTATVRADDPSQSLFLMEATERVLTRRLAAVPIANPTVSVTPSGSGSAVVRVTVPDAAAVESVQRILAEDFSFDMRLGKTTSGNAPSDPAEDSWGPPVLTEADLQWAQAIGNSATGVVSVELLFTPQGQKNLEGLFRGNRGQDIGIFVRDLLVSKLRITDEKVQERIVISGIPNAKVAQIFADDVDVGLRVSFSSPL